MPSANYNWLFVGEAAVLGLLTAITMFRLYIRALRSQGAQRTLWLGLSSLIAGLGAWATNFSAILAYDPGVETAYDPLWASASLAVAIAVGLGLAPTVNLRGTWRPSVLGGVYTGVVLTILQVVTVKARIVPGDLVWHEMFLVAAVVVGSVLATLALAVALPSRKWWERLVSAVLLTAAALGQHLICMAGLEIRPGSAPLPDAGIAQWQMALAVGAVTVLLAGGALILAALDRRTQRIARHRMRELADAALDGLIMCEQGTILDANAGFSRLVEVDRYALRGRAITDFVSPNHRARLPEVAGEVTEMDLVSADGKHIPVEVVLRALGSNGSHRHVLAVRDVRERKHAQERIHHLAYHDALTGLANRVLFRQTLEGALDRAEKEEKGVAVLCLDLDHFKTVNDTLGHPVGDALLKEVAERLRGCVRKIDTVSRLGGDEFAIVMPFVDRPEEIATLARRVVAVVGAPYFVGGQELNAGASVGIAVAPKDGDDPDLLLKNADVALYKAKNEGRSTHRFFEPEMGASLQARRALEVDLRQGLSRGEFVLFYQPLIDVKSNQISGCEALLRWRHPDRGMISPAEFIPVAEEIGLIGALGEWVLREACWEAARWPAHVKVAVNLSAAQFRSRSLVQTVLRTLAETGLRPGRLELEITESVLLQESSSNLDTLHQLRGLGVRISMDDFGTGYSSLNYLRSFPFDKIKIDRSFVKDLPNSSDCMAIIRAVTGLGSSLGMTTTAEGVETEQQLRQLRLEGCTEVQGYLFSRPVPAHEMRAMIGCPEPADDVEANGRENRQPDGAARTSGELQPNSVARRRAGTG